MQTSALALRVAIPNIQITNPQSAEVQEFITRAAILSKSGLIQGQQMLVKELLGFFQAAAATGAVQEKTMGELYGYVSIATQAAAKAFARAAFYSKDAAKKGSVINDMNGKITQKGNEVKGCLCLGELGILQDLSTLGDIFGKVSQLFKDSDEAIRTAASICLGNISVGNPDFFLAKVFKLVDGAEHHEKYLFLNTIREIIIHNPKCLKQFIPKLLSLLLEQSRNEDEQIRGIVAENLGRTYIYYS
jgi:hypothetical protein